MTKYHVFRLFNRTANLDRIWIQLTNSDQRDMQQLRRQPTDTLSASSGFLQSHHHFSSQQQGNGLKTGHAG